MKRIPVDFDLIDSSGHVCLTTSGAVRAIKEQGYLLNGERVLLIGERDGGLVTVEANVFETIHEPVGWRAVQSLALALDSKVSNVELHALARLARQVSGLNEVRLADDEHRERLSAQQLEYSNKLAAAVASLCERTVGAAFESFGLPRCGSPVPKE